MYLKAGVPAKNIARVEGSLKLKAALNARVASFDPADAGGSKTVHGVHISLKKVTGPDAVFELEGPDARIVSAFGFDANQSPLALKSWSPPGDGRMSYQFAGQPSRIDVIVAESFAERVFPFALTPTSVAGSAGATALPVASAAPVPPKVASAPTPAPAPNVPLVARPALVAAAAEPKLAAAQPKPDPAPTPPKVAEVERESPAAPALARTIEPAEPMMVRTGRPGPKYNDLMSAVMSADLAAVDELLAFGKWVDKPDSRGVTPLSVAIYFGDAKIAESLLRAGASPEPAFAVARSRQDAAMTTLLEKYRK
jgi:hypothetical protein